MSERNRPEFLKSIGPAAGLPVAISSANGLSAVNRAGDPGAAAIWSGSRHALHDGTEGRVVDSAYLHQRSDSE